MTLGQINIWRYDVKQALAACLSERRPFTLITRRENMTYRFDSDAFTRRPRWIVTITFMDGSTRTRTYETKREATAEQNRALTSRIVLTADVKPGV